MEGTPGDDTRSTVCYLANYQIMYYLIYDIIYLGEAHCITDALILKDFLVLT